MSNIFLKQPQLLSNITDIRQARRFESGEAAIVLGQNIIRPETGGQPYDRGLITVGDSTFQTGRIFKADGDTWISLKDAAEVPCAGEMACVEVDAERRQRLSQCHTLTHLLMAAARHVVTGFDSKGACIDDDERTVSIAFRAAAKPTEDQLKIVDALTRRFVLRDVPISLSQVKSPEAGAQRFAKWRVDSELNLTGQIRVVEIQGIDANPCSGSHVRRTGEIPAFAIKAASSDERDIVTLEAELTSDWTYWYADRFIKECAGVDLSVFE